MKQQNHFAVLQHIYHLKWLNKKVSSSFFFEVNNNNIGVGRASDMYAIGVLLYEML